MTRPLQEIAADVAVCARAWEPEARLLGNVRADEIDRLAEFVVSMYALPCHDSACWHCGDEVYGERPRCERCPAECDIELCAEPGCLPGGAS